jgi:hypothetical protein
MSNELAERLNEALPRFFNGYWLMLNLKKTDEEKINHKKVFFDFLEEDKDKKTKQLKELLDDLSDERKISKSKLVLEQLDEDQKEEYGAFFRPKKEPEIDDRQVLEQFLDHGVIDIIEGTKEYQDLIKVAPNILTKNELQTFGSKIAGIIYEKLSEEQKRDIDINKLTKYCLNVGILRMKRTSHRAAYDFIKEYQPLFRSESQVLERIVDRYIEDELFRTRPEKTSERIDELKEEIKELYEGIE